MGTEKRETAARLTAERLAEVIEAEAPAMSGVARGELEVTLTQFARTQGDALDEGTIRRAVMGCTPFVG